VMDLFDDS
jgi:ribonuclease-3